MSNSNKLYVECNGQGMPILLIHGVLSDHTFFNGVARHLSEHCQAISYDRRGYGENQIIEGADCSLRTQAEDAYQVLTRYTNEPACVVGHSAGAHIALELAIRYPQSVKHLVLVEPSLGLELEDAKKLKQWHDEVAHYAENNGLLRIFTSFQKATGARRGEKTAACVQPQPVAMERMRKNLKAYANGDLKQQYAFTPSEAQLRALSVPVTIALTQPNEDNLFYTISKHDAAYLNWPVVSFPGTHSSIEEYSQLFARKLMEVFQF